jgi:hypothetical protein
MRPLYERDSRQITLCEEDGGWMNAYLTKDCWPHRIQAYRIVPV